QLLATNSIRNAQGGLINGQDVSLIALTGDISNERTISQQSLEGRGFSQLTSVVDKAAGIEASNDLQLLAGGDIQNIGGSLKAGGDAKLDAGGDVVIASAAEEHGSMRKDKRHFWSTSSTTQHGSDVQVGGNLAVTAGQDIAVVASAVKADGDVLLDAGRDVTIAAAANESSSEYHYKRSGKKVDKENSSVRQQAAVIEAGGDFVSISGANTNLIASQVIAGQEAYLYAKESLNLDAAQNQDYSYFYKKKKSGGLFSRKKSSMSETSSDWAVSSSIRSGSDLILVADRDIATRGAQLSSDETIFLYAGRNILLDAAENSASQTSAKSKSNLLSSKASSNSNASTSLTSTSLNGKSVELLADNDIALRAAAVYADEGIILDAGRDISISTGQQSQHSSSASASSKLNWNLTNSLAANGSFTLTDKSKGAQQTTTQDVGSTLSGGTIDIDSGRDIAIRGSTLVADSDIRLDAARNLSVLSGETSNTSSANSKTKNTGEIGSWYHGAMGVASLKQASQSSSSTQNSSQIASLGGNVDLTAGERYNQVASQVIAPTGDISIIGKNVDIEAGYDKLSATQKQSSSRTAIGGSVSVPLVDAVRNIQRMSDAAENTGDTRLKALAAVNSAMYANTAYNSAQALASNSLGGIKISANLSNDKGSSSSTQSGQNVVSSTVVAGRDLSITATGGEESSDLNVVGSQLSAGRDVKLKADGDINLLAAKNTAEQHSNNSGSGWSVGVGFAFGGAQNGFTLDLAANKSRGNADGSDVSWTHTTVEAGNALGFWSGQDTNLKGAVVSGEQVVADVGGDLNIESLQDTSTYQSKQTIAGVGVSLCIPPFCAGASSVSASANQQKIDSEYASVMQQSGVKAGDKGFNITVGGNTDLKGAVIASTDEAVTNGRNQLVTGTLTSSDIKNEAEYKASSIGLGGGYSWGSDSGASGVGRDQDGNASAGAGGDKLPSKDGMSATAPVALSASGDASSTTRSGISGGTILITDSEKQKQLTGQDAETTIAQLERDVSSEKDGANALQPIFDEKEILAGFEITTAFVQNVATYLEQKAREVDSKRADAEAIEAQANNLDNGLTTAERLALLAQAQVLMDEAKAINDNWGAGGTYRQIATVLTAAAGGQVNAGTNQFAQNMVVNYLQQQGAGYIGKLVEDGSLTEGSPLHAALHAIVGCGAAAASQQSCSAGAMGAAASSVLTGLFTETSPDETSEQREAKRNLILSIVTGIAAVTDPDSAATANNAATANVDNNWLSTQQKVQRKKELAEAETVAEQLKVYAKWKKISAEQDFATAKGLAKGLADGLAGSGLDTLDTMARFTAFPVESLDEISEMINAPAMKQLLGAKYEEMQQSIEKAKVALTVGGLDQAEQLGMQIGHIISVAVTLVVAVEADAVKAAGQAARFGVAVTKEKAGVLMAGSTEKLAAQLATIEKYGFDGDVPLVPKEVNGPKATGSVPNLTERGTLVNLRPNDVAIAQRPVRTLVQDESGRYWLQTSTGKRITPSGSYDFVTMPDGSIRVARPNVNQDFSTHLGLSGGGEVKYAGSIRFGNNDGPSRGTITQWTNNSGHYQPPATLSGNAGLPQGLFNLR
ncbi:hemagglutinin repeat-containing protein, partial [Pseudomonas sp.]|uniref:hemagglutinin repeat-containing protein n=1 Tax=Pseudomonas sp. TaxID=306 RepID=UPI003A96C0CF